MNFIWVYCSKNLDTADIFVGNRNFNIKSIGEEGEAKVFKQVFFQIVHLSGTEIVEPFHFI